MKKIVRKAIVYFMLMALLMPSVGNAGFAFADETAMAANQSVLMLTDEMALNGKITVKNEAWEKIVIGSDVKATQVTLQDVIAKEVIADNGIALTVSGGTIAKLTAQSAAPATIVTTNQAKIDTIAVGESVVLNLADGNVGNLIVTSASADKQIKLEVNGFNGNIHVRQAGETVPTNGNKVHFQITNSKIKEMLVESNYAACVVDAADSIIDKIEAEGTAGRLEANAAINKLILNENAKKMEVTIYSKVDSLVAKGSGNYIWTSQYANIGTSSVSGNNSLKALISQSAWFNARHRDVVITTPGGDRPGEDEADIPVRQRVTREELIYALAEIFGIQGVSDGNHAYDDYAKAQNAAVIETAVRAGYITLEPDQDNMVLFNPKGYATREFTAQTIGRMLGIAAAAEVNAPWTDIADVGCLTEAVYTVDTGIFDLINNCFKPERSLSKDELRKAVDILTRLKNSYDIEGEARGTVDYAEDVVVEEVVYDLDKENKIVTIPTGLQRAETEYTEGGIYVLQNPDDSGEGIAIKVTEVTHENGYTIIKYEEPELAEVISSIEVEGSTTTGGTFTPAEGVTVTDDGVATFAVWGNARGPVGSTIPLIGKRTYTVSIDGKEVSMSIDMKEIEYRFDVKTSWLPPFIDIREVYVALNTEISTEIDFASLGAGIDKRILLGDINIPLAYGINLSGELVLIISAEGGISTELTVSSRTGIQYRKGGWINPVYHVTPSLDPVTINGAAQLGLGFEPEVEFLGMDLVGLAVDVGIGAEASLGFGSPTTVCMDVETYIFLTVSAKFGPDILNLKADLEIMNSDWSIWQKKWHFENMRRVPECTQTAGDYSGYVRNAYTDAAIAGAKVQVIKDGQIIDTKYTDASGQFRGSRLPIGRYTLRVAAPGYIPYEQSFDIMAGSTTSLPTQLMIERNNTSGGGSSGSGSSGGTEVIKYVCEGRITSAVTGNGLVGVTIDVSSVDLFGENEEVASVVTGADGHFSFELPAGKYALSASLGGYVSNMKYITVTGNVNNIALSISPENLDIETGGGMLRIVLHWGLEPWDLDSHLIGTDSIYGPFHVYFANKEENAANLDVDDVDGEGPETITVTYTASGSALATGSALQPTDSTFSYYVHNYTNRYDTENSYKMAQSGAYVQVYSGSTLLYTINIPADKEGTLWHVFDYNVVTGTITLVNEFSYQESPSAVGQGYAAYSRRHPSDDK